MSFKPGVGGEAVQSKSFVGTLRITGKQPEPADKSEETKAASPFEYRASGDLYDLTDVRDPAKSKAAKRPVPIPHFGMDAYRYYLEVHAVDASQSGKARLEITAHDYDRESRTLKPRSRMQMVLESDDDGWTFKGSLKNGEEVRGAFQLQWISDFVRRADLRMFAIAPAALPKTKVLYPGADIPRMAKALAKANARAGIAGKFTGKNGAPEKIPGWQDLFNAIQWDLQITKLSGTDLEHTPDAWAAYDLSEAARALREGQAKRKSRNGKPPAAEGWIYDLLCVSKFESQFQNAGQGSNYLGIMFDTEATDLNRQPRESAAVAALQTVRENGRDVCFQDALGGAAYYRTALHEVGHAMNLPHYLQGNSLMNTTGLLVQFPTPSDDSTEKLVPFRFDVGWNFSPEDVDWLQHAPDIVVRPGGISRRGARLQQEMRPPPSPLSLRAATDMVLNVSPVLDEFPFGAPVRFNYALGNRGLEPRRVPQDISLRGGYVMGRVTGPDRVTRFFRSVFRCCDTARAEDPLKELKPGESLEDSMTILRGIDGPLFPKAGAYEIELELRWDAGDQTHRITGRTFITVKEINNTDPAQGIAASLILTDTTMMPPLVQGLIQSNGLRTLSVALRSRELAAHYLVTALRCMIKGEERQVDWDDKSKLGGPVIPISLSNSNDGTATPARFNASAAPEGVNRMIVLTKRERNQLQARFPEAFTSETDGPADSGYKNVVLPPDAEAWIQRVYRFTIPLEDDAAAPAASSRNSSRNSSWEQPVK